MQPLELELLAHTTALRTLARALVGDQQADDLVQDAVLQVLAVPPKRPASLRGWLMAILRHRASKYRRGEQRRLVREGCAAPPDPAATPARIAEHKETLQRLTRALTALPEPYSGTLVLRYFEGLQPAAISLRTGVPLATVKSRLQRGLVLLRQHLAADGSDWRGALGAVFGSGVSASLPIAATVTGVLFMGSATKLILGGATLAAALLLWLALQSAPDELHPSVVASLSAQPTTANIERPAAADLANAANPDGTAAVNRTAVDQPVAMVRIRGRCVDEQGTPIAGCAVTLRGRRITGGMGKDFAGEYAEWLRVRGGNDWQDLEVATRGDGCFEFAMEPSPLNLALLLRRDRLDHRVGLGQRQDAGISDLGDLLVPTTCEVRIRVIDSQGLPVATPLLGINFASTAQQTMVAAASHRTPSPRYASPALRGDGQFTMLLVDGQHTCGVSWRQILRGEQFVVPPGVAALAHEIVVAALPTDEVVRGVVVDERDLPLAGVDVRASSRTAGAGAAAAAAACTDANGRFVLPRPAVFPSEVDLTVDKDGYEPQQRRLPFGGPEQRFVLRQECTISVHVVADADGVAVEDYLVRSWWDVGSHPAVFDNEGSARADDHHPNGLAVVTGISRGSHLLVIEPLRPELWRSDPLPVLVTGNSPARLKVRLHAAVKRVLRVRMSDGSPVGDANCELVDADDEVGKGTPLVELEKWNPRKPERVALIQAVETDNRGEALLHGPAEVPLTLRISCGGVTQQIVTPVRLDATDPLEVVLPAAARLVVKVGPPSMVAELRAACGLPPHGPAPRNASRSQPGFRLFRRTGSQTEMQPPHDQAAVLIAGDGSVEFAKAPPGDWLLGLEEYDELDGKVRSWTYPRQVAAVTLRSGETTEIELDLSDRLPGVFDGTILCNGKPLPNAAICIEIERPTPEFPWPARWLVNARTDADGCFQIRTRQGTLRIAVDRSEQIRAVSAGISGYQLVYATRPVFLPAGGQLAQTIDVVSASLRLRLLDTRGDPVAGVSLYLQVAQAWQQHHTAISDADGWIPCEVEPTTFTVQVLPRSLQDDDAQARYLRERPSVRNALATARLQIGQVTVTAGKPVEVTLRLPPEWER